MSGHDWLDGAVRCREVRLVVEEMNDAAGRPFVARAEPRTEPGTTPEISFSSRAAGSGAPASGAAARASPWPWKGDRADPSPAITWTFPREVVLSALVVEQGEEAWVRRYRVEVSRGGGAWEIAVPSRRVDPRHRRPQGFSSPVRLLESSHLPPAEGTRWVHSFYEDYLLRSIEYLGPGSEFPDWLTAKYFVSAASEPFAFAHCYNPGDCGNFDSLIAAILCPEMAVETERILADTVNRFGFLPAVMGPGKDDRAFALDYSGLNWPPSCYRDIASWTKDRAFLEWFGAACEQWALWVLANRDADGDGWLEPGMNGCAPSTEEFRTRGAQANPEIARRNPEFWDYHALQNPEQAAFQAAIYELGTDDYPIYVSGRHKGVKWDPKTRALNIHYLDTQLFMCFLSGFVASTHRSLGRSAEGKRFEETAERFRRLVADHCWDTHTGFYYDVDGDTGRLRTEVKHAQGFLPMAAGIPTIPQAERMVEHLLDPKEFWTAFPVPSISVDSPDFQPFGYWSGRSWPPSNFMVLRGLLNYGFFDVADALLERWMAHTKSCRRPALDGASTRRHEGFAIYDARRVAAPDIEWIVPENWNCMTGEVHGAGALTWGGLWIPAVIMRNFWPFDDERVLVRPGGAFRMTWGDRWDIAVDGRTGWVNGRGFRMDANTTYLHDPRSGETTALAPGRADPLAIP